MASKNAQDYGYDGACKLATTGKEAMSLFAEGWRQESDYTTDDRTTAAISIAEWRPETRNRIADINAPCWVIFAPPA